MDHDQHFKTLIREFFDGFMELFFAEWAEQMDFSNVEWLDKEIYPNPPEGSEHVLDLVAKVLFRDKTRNQAVPTLILVHIEIESKDRTTNLKPRLPYYFHFLRDQYNLPVLPIVIYLKTSLQGLGEDEVIETLGGFAINRFRYLYVALPGLDAVEYLEGDNWLGVALSALMRIPSDQVAWVGAEALQRLSQAPLSTRRRRFLGNCVEAYLDLDEQQRAEFQNLLTEEAYQRSTTMNLTSYEKGQLEGIAVGRTEGREEGREEGRREVICLALEEKFGELSEEVRDAVAKLSLDEIRRMLLKIGTVHSLSELGLPDSTSEEG